MNRDEEIAFSKLLAILEPVESWLARISPTNPDMKIDADSPLAADDKLTHPYPTSYAAIALFGHAIDHIHMLRVALHAGTLNIYAPYTLVRGALENAASIAWLLAPDDQSTRLIRRFRLAVVDINMSERVKELMGYVGPRSKNERLDEIRDLALKAGLSPADAARRLTFSDIVSDADQESPLPDKKVKLVWNICSGMAHGDPWATLGGNRLVELPGAPPGTKHMQNSSDVENLLFVTFTARRMIEHAFQLYDQRGAASS
ncbi:hypothetical protein [Polymorphospora rubra]|uniref:Uncharacterized protein n=1 Tax=Polymorphospora rubra TaxID=338584 RepID=A0A810MVD1_9ACTN|nr:hypothetical protein [Polymorphospora rubra]BCJ65111.1 hypothetical protein Prubr_21320 [Polymorphospora rubra]